MRASFDTWVRRVERSVDEQHAGWQRLEENASAVHLTAGAHEVPFGERSEVHLEIDQARLDHGAPLLVLETHVVRRDRVVVEVVDPADDEAASDLSGDDLLDAAREHLAPVWRRQPDGQRETSEGNRGCHDQKGCECAT